MKKGVAFLVVFLVAGPALGADWSFYGSQRMSTFYVNRDYGDFTQPGTTEKDDWDLQWNFQTNSRLGGNVKADKVNGKIELALKAANGGDGGDEAVATRVAYGMWKFSDNAALKVGKDYSPVYNAISNQVFKDDDNMEGSGVFHGRRPAGLTLILGGLELALLTNALKDSSSGASDITPAGTDLDWNLPKIEARYSLKMDAFQLVPFGGFQYFKVADNNSTLQDDLDIYSYVLGLTVKLNLGALYFGANGSYGQNWNNANWKNGGYNAASSSTATLKSGGDDVNDTTSYMLGLIFGVSATDRLKFEAGFGYRNDDPGTPGSKNDDFWQGYVNATLTLAPGVNIVPEIGYQDFMDNASGDDEGYQWYAGAKWQIDF
jgi:hypothetical protein